jgi:hypothetical protein
MGKSWSSESESKGHILGTTLQEKEEPGTIFLWRRNSWLCENWRTTDLVDDTGEKLLWAKLKVLNHCESFTIPLLTPVSDGSRPPLVQGKMTCIPP